MRQPLHDWKVTSTERHLMRTALARTFTYMKAARVSGTDTFRHELFVAVKHANAALERVEARRLKGRRR